MIPKGLPGEGNLLVFDNGGEGGYGTPNPGALTGVNNARRDYSRVLEFNPVTLHWKQEICYLRMHRNFIVPTSVQHRDFQMETL